MCESVQAQFQQTLFPELEGEELLEAVEDAYAPTRILPYSMTRDTMFTKVDLKEDSLTCVYTGFTIYLSRFQDPTQAAFSAGINTEHTWPRSKGAEEEPARSDMHHLFPTRVDVNGERGNLPFGEVSDGQALIWFFDNQQSTRIPSQNKNAFSKLGIDRFQPRSDHKGDVARAIFYFYTFYQAQAKANAPTYLAEQIEDLCQWHYEDPVGDKEWTRSQRIATIQGTPNPFVLDCTLASRSYCADFAQLCTTTSTQAPIEAPTPTLSLQPNPTTEAVQIQYQLSTPARLQLRAFNSLGQEVASLINADQAAGTFQFNWSPPAPGLYFLQLTIQNEKQSFVKAAPLLVH